MAKFDIYHSSQSAGAELLPFFELTFAANSNKVLRSEGETYTSNENLTSLNVSKYLDSRMYWDFVNIKDNMGKSQDFGAEFYEKRAWGRVTNVNSASDFRFLPSVSDSDFHFYQAKSSWDDGNLDNLDFVVPGTGSDKSVLFCKRFDPVCLVLDLTDAPDSDYEYCLMGNIDISANLSGHAYRVGYRVMENDDPQSVGYYSSDLYSKARYTSRVGEKIHWQGVVPLSLKGGRKYRIAICVEHDILEQSGASQNCKPGAVLSLSGGVMHAIRVDGSSYASAGNGQSSLDTTANGTQTQHVFKYAGASSDGGVAIGSTAGSHSIVRRVSLDAEDLRGGKYLIAFSGSLAKGSGVTSPAGQKREVGLSVALAHRLTSAAQNINFKDGYDTLDYIVNNSWVQLRDENDSVSVGGVGIFECPDKSTVGNTNTGAESATLYPYKKEVVISLIGNAASSPVKLENYSVVAIKILNNDNSAQHTAFESAETTRSSYRSNWHAASKVNDEGFYREIELNKSSEDTWAKVPIDYLQSGSDVPQSNPTQPYMQYNPNYILNATVGGKLAGAPDSSAGTTSATNLSVAKWNNTSGFPAVNSDGTYATESGHSSFDLLPVTGGYRNITAVNNAISGYTAISNSTSGYLSIGPDESGDINLGQNWTMCFVAKLFTSRYDLATSSSYQFIKSKTGVSSVTITASPQGTSNDDAPSVDNTHEELRVNFYTNNKYRIIWLDTEAALLFKPGNWHMFTFRREGNTYYFYLDGKLAGSTGVHADAQGQDDHFKQVFYNNVGELVELVVFKGAMDEESISFHHRRLSDKYKVIRYVDKDRVQLDPSLFSAVAYPSNGNYLELASHQGVRYSDEEYKKFTVFSFAPEMFGGSDASFNTVDEIKTIGQDNGLSWIGARYSSSTTITMASYAGSARDNLDGYGSDFVEVYVEYSSSEADGKMTTSQYGEVAIGDLYELVLSPESALGPYKADLSGKTGEGKSSIEVQVVGVDDSYKSEPGGALADRNLFRIKFRRTYAASDTLPYRAERWIGSTEAANLYKDYIRKVSGANQSPVVKASFGEVQDSKKNHLPITLTINDGVLTSADVGFGEAEPEYEFKYTPLGLRADLKAGDSTSGKKAGQDSSKDLQYSGETGEFTDYILDYPGDEYGFIWALLNEDIDLENKYWTESIQNRAFAMEEQKLGKSFSYRDGSYDGHVLYPDTNKAGTREGYTIGTNAWSGWANIDLPVSTTGTGVTGARGHFEHASNRTHPLYGLVLKNTITPINKDGTSWAENRVIASGTPKIDTPAWEMQGFSSRHVKEWINYFYPPAEYYSLTTSASATTTGYMGTKENEIMASTHDLGKITLTKEQRMLRMAVYSSAAPGTNETFTYCLYKTGVGALEGGDNPATTVTISGSNVKAWVEFGDVSPYSTPYFKSGDSYSVRVTASAGAATADHNYFIVAQEVVNRVSSIGTGAFSSSSENTPTDSNYPVSNVTDGDSSNKWKTVSWSDDSTARIIFDTNTSGSTEISPAMFKLIGCNATSGRVRLYGANDASLTDDVIYYDFDLYDASSTGEHVFFPEAAAKTNSKVGVKWASSYMLSNFSAVGNAIKNAGNIYNTGGDDALNPYWTDSSGDISVYKFERDDFNHRGEHARYISTSYYGGTNPKKPTDWQNGPYRGNYGADSGTIDYWGNSTDQGAEEQYQLVVLKSRPGGLDQFPPMPASSLANVWTQVGSSDVWKWEIADITSPIDGATVKPWTANARRYWIIYYNGSQVTYSSSIPTEASMKFSQVLVPVTGGTGDATLYINLGGANPNGNLTIYSNYQDLDNIRPIYFHQDDANRLATDSSTGIKYYALDAYGNNNFEKVIRGVGNALGNAHYALTIGFRLHASTGADNWVFSQWSYTDANDISISYLRDREVLRVQSRTTADAGALGYVDIAIAESTIADGNFHVITVSVAADKSVKVILDGYNIGDVARGNSLIDYNHWKVGTMPPSGYSLNGTAEENAMVTDVGPFGDTQVVWESPGNDSDENADGGWNGHKFSIEPTKLYRFSVWVKRSVIGNGRAYLGTRAYQGASGSQSLSGLINRSETPRNPSTFKPNSNGDWVLKYKIVSVGNTNWQSIGAPVGAGVGTEFVATGSISGTTGTAYYINQNPYFDHSKWTTDGGDNGDPLDSDKWFLVVGHLYPHDDTGTGKHADTGWYEANSTTKIKETNLVDFKWANGDINKAIHRAYLYYSSITTTKQQWAYPRVDLVDGTEPSISDLVNTNPNTGYIPYPGVLSGNVVSSGIGGQRVPNSYTRLNGADYSDYPGKIDIAYMSLGDDAYAFAQDRTSVDSWSAMANKEGRFTLGLYTEDLKRRYWAVDFDGITRLGIGTTPLEIGEVVLEAGDVNGSAFAPDDGINIYHGGWADAWLYPSTTRNPTFSDSNGFKSLVFDGSDDRLENSAGYAAALATYKVASGYTASTRQFFGGYWFAAKLASDSSSGVYPFISYGGGVNDSGITYNHNEKKFRVASGRIRSSDSYYDVNSPQKLNAESLNDTNTGWVYNSSNVTYEYSYDMSWNDAAARYFVLKQRSSTDILSRSPSYTHEHSNSYKVDHSEWGSYVTTSNTIDIANTTSNPPTDANTWYHDSSNNKIIVKLDSSDSAAAIKNIYIKGYRWQAAEHRNSVDISSEIEVSRDEWHVFGFSISYAGKVTVWVDDVKAGEGQMPGGGFASVYEMPSFPTAVDVEDEDRDGNVTATRLRARDNGLGEKSAFYFNSFGKNRWENPAGYAAYLAGSGDQNSATTTLYYFKGELAEIRIWSDYLNSFSNTTGATSLHADEFNLKTDEFRRVNQILMEKFLRPKIGQSLAQWINTGRGEGDGLYTQPDFRFYQGTASNMPTVVQGPNGYDAVGFSSSSNYSSGGDVVSFTNNFHQSPGGTTGYDPNFGLGNEFAWFTVVKFDKKDVVPNQTLPYPALKWRLQDSTPSDSITGHASLVIDHLGNHYFGASNDSNEDTTVTKVAPDGTTTVLMNKAKVLAATGTPLAGMLRLAISANGDLYVGSYRTAVFELESDAQKTNAIYKYTASTGVITKILSHEGDGATIFHNCKDVVVDSEDNVYALSPGYPAYTYPSGPYIGQTTLQMTSGVVFRIKPDGSISKTGTGIGGTGAYSMLRDDDSGDIYIGVHSSSSSATAAYKITNPFTSSEQVTSILTNAVDGSDVPPGDTDASSRIHGVVSIALDSNKNFYAAGYYGDAIAKVTPSGTKSILTNLDNGSFVHHDSLLFDDADNLYIACRGGGGGPTAADKVLRLDAVSGVLETVMEIGAATTLDLRDPLSFYQDPTSKEIFTASDYGIWRVASPYPTAEWRHPLMSNSVGSPAASLFEFVSQDAEGNGYLNVRTIYKFQDPNIEDDAAGTAYSEEVYHEVRADVKIAPDTWNVISLVRDLDSRVTYGGYKHRFRIYLNGEELANARGTDQWEIAGSESNQSMSRVAPGATGVEWLGKGNDTFLCGAIADMRGLSTGSFKHLNNNGVAVHTKQSIADTQGQSSLVGGSYKFYRTSISEEDIRATERILANTYGITHHILHKDNYTTSPTLPKVPAGTNLWVHLKADTEILEKADDGSAINTASLIKKDGNAVSKSGEIVETWKDVSGNSNDFNRAPRYLLDYPNDNSGYHLALFNEDILVGIGLWQESHLPLWDASKSSQSLGKLIPYVDPYVDSNYLPYSGSHTWPSRYWGAWGSKTDRVGSVDSRTSPLFSSDTYLANVIASLAGSEDLAKAQKYRGLKDSPSRHNLAEIEDTIYGWNNQERYGQAHPLDPDGHYYNARSFISSDNTKGTPRVNTNASADGGATEFKSMVFRDRTISGTVLGAIPDFLEREWAENQIQAFVNTSNRSSISGVNTGRANGLYWGAISVVAKLTNPDNITDKVYPLVCYGETVNTNSGFFYKHNTSTGKGNFRFRVSPSMQVGSSTAEYYKLGSPWASPWAEVSGSAHGGAQLLFKDYAISLTDLGFAVKGDASNWTTRIHDLWSDYDNAVFGTQDTTWTSRNNHEDYGSAKGSGGLTLTKVEGGWDSTSSSQGPNSWTVYSSGGEAYLKVRLFALGAGISPQATLLVQGDRWTEDSHYNEIDITSTVAIEMDEWHVFAMGWDFQGTVIFLVDGVAAGSGIMSGGHVDSYFNVGSTVGKTALPAALSKAAYDNTLLRVKNIGRGVYEHPNGWKKYNSIAGSESNTVDEASVSTDYFNGEIAEIRIWNDYEKYDGWDSSTDTNNGYNFSQSMTDLSATAGYIRSATLLGNLLDLSSTLLHKFNIGGNSSPKYIPNAINGYGGVQFDSSKKVCFHRAVPTSGGSNYSKIKGSDTFVVVKIEKPWQSGPIFRFAQTSVGIGENTEGVQKNAYEAYNSGSGARGVTTDISTFKDSVADSNGESGKSGSSVILYHGSEDQWLSRNQSTAGQSASTDNDLGTLGAGSYVFALSYQGENDRCPSLSINGRKVIEYSTNESKAPASVDARVINDWFLGGVGLVGDNDAHDDTPASHGDIGYFDGCIAEYLSYGYRDAGDQPLSDADRDDILQYLSLKYDIEVFAPRATAGNINPQASSSTALVTPLGTSHLTAGDGISREYGMLSSFYLNYGERYQGDPNSISFEVKSTKEAAAKGNTRVKVFDPSYAWLKEIPALDIEPDTNVDIVTEVEEGNLYKRTWEGPTGSSTNNSNGIWVASSYKINLPKSNMIGRVLRNGEEVDKLDYLDLTSGFPTWGDNKSNLWYWDEDGKYLHLLMSSAGTSPNDDSQNVVVYSKNYYGREGVDITQVGNANKTYSTTADPTGSDTSEVVTSTVADKQLKGEEQIPYEPRVNSVPGYSQDLQESGTSANVSTSVGSLGLIGSDGEFHDDTGSKLYEGGRTKVYRSFPERSHTRDLELVVDSVQGSPVVANDTFSMTLFDDLAKLNDPLSQVSFETNSDTGSQTSYSAVDWSIYFGKHLRVPAYRVTNALHKSGTSLANYQVFKVCDHPISLVGDAVVSTVTTNTSGTGTSTQSSATGFGLYSSETSEYAFRGDQSLIIVNEALLKCGMFAISRDNNAFLDVNNLDGNSEISDANKDAEEFFNAQTLYVDILGKPGSKFSYGPGAISKYLLENYPNVLDEDVGHYSTTTAAIYQPQVLTSNLGLVEGNLAYLYSANVEVVETTDFSKFPLFAKVKLIDGGDASKGTYFHGTIVGVNSAEYTLAIQPQFVVGDERLDQKEIGGTILDSSGSAVGNWNDVFTNKADTTFAIGSTLIVYEKSIGLDADIDGKIDMESIRNVDRHFRKKQITNATATDPVRYGKADASIAISGSSSLSDALNSVAEQFFTYWYFTKSGRGAIGVLDLDYGNLLMNAGVEATDINRGNLNSSSHTKTRVAFPWKAHGSSPVGSGDIETTKTFDGSQALIVKSGINKGYVEQPVYLAPGKYGFSVPARASTTGAASSAGISILLAGNNSSEIFSEAIALDASSWTRINLIFDVREGDSGICFARVYPDILEAKSSGNEVNIIVDNLQIYKIAGVVSDHNSNIDNIAQDPDGFYAAKVSYEINPRTGGANNYQKITDSEALGVGLSASQSRSAFETAGILDFQNSNSADKDTATEIAARALGYYSRPRQQINFEFIGIEALPQIGDWVFFDRQEISKSFTGGGDSPFARIKSVNYSGQDSSNAVTIVAERHVDFVTDRDSSAAGEFPVGAIVLCTGAACPPGFDDITEAYSNSFLGGPESNTPPEVNTLKGEYTHNHTARHGHEVAPHTHSATITMGSAANTPADSPGANARVPHWQSMASDPTSSISGTWLLGDPAANYNRNSYGKHNWVPMSSHDHSTSSNVGTTSGFTGLNASGGDTGRITTITNTGSNFYTHVNVRLCRRAGQLRAETSPGSFGITETNNLPSTIIVGYSEAITTAPASFAKATSIYQGSDGSMAQSNAGLIRCTGVLNSAIDASFGLKASNPSGGSLFLSSYNSKTNLTRNTTQKVRVTGDLTIAANTLGNLLEIGKRICFKRDAGTYTSKINAVIHGIGAPLNGEDTQRDIEVEPLNEAYIYNGATYGDRPVRAYPEDLSTGENIDGWLLTSEDTSPGKVLDNSIYGNLHTHSTRILIPHSHTLYHSHTLSASANSLFSGYVSTGHGSSEIIYHGFVPSWAMNGEGPYTIVAGTQYLKDVIVTGSTQQDQLYVHVNPSTLQGYGYGGNASDYNDGGWSYPPINHQHSFVKNNIRTNMLGFATDEASASAEVDLYARQQGDDSTTIGPPMVRMHWLHPNLNSVGGSLASDLKSDVPSGAIIFFEGASCPTGYVRFEAADGYLFAAQRSDALGYSVESLNHYHKFIADIHNDNNTGDSFAHSHSQYSNTQSGGAVVTAAAYASVGGSGGYQYYKSNSTSVTSFSSKAGTAFSVPSASSSTEFYVNGLYPNDNPNDYLKITNSLNHWRPGPHESDVNSRPTNIDDATTEGAHTHALSTSFGSGNASVSETSGQKTNAAGVDSGGVSALGEGNEATKPKYRELLACKRN